MNRSILKKSTFMLLLLLPGLHMLANAAANHPRANTCTIGASAFVSGTLGCINTTVLLRGNSPTAGVTYSWTGPNGFTSTSQNPTVQTPGVYTLVVTSPAGCTGTATVTVIQNVVPPAILVATTLSGSTNLNCDGATQTLSASSSTGGTSYSWVYQNSVIASSPTTTINQPGGYTLIALNPVNGCADSALVSITNEYKSLGLYAAGGALLTCARNSGILKAFIAGGTVEIQNLVYNWTGPNGFSANTITAAVYTGGLYNFTVTDTTTGCSQGIYTIALVDTAPPIVTAANSGPLTCTVSEVTLTGSSTSPNVEYQWDGPDGYLSFSAQDVATEPGNYVLTVINDDNGCMLKDTTTVDYECSTARKATNPTAAAAATVVIPVFEWKAWPNPFSKRALISFRSPTADVVNIQVYNNNGSLEKTLFNNKVLPGQPYQLSLSALPAGMHHVVIRINNQVYTRKLIAL